MHLRALALFIVMFKYLVECLRAMISLLIQGISEREKESRRQRHVMDVPCRAQQWGDGLQPAQGGGVGVRKMSLRR